MTTTTQKLADLKNLTQASNANTFRRVQLATEILDDRKWIAQVHDGNEDVAVKAIEDEYFRGMAGYLGLFELREIYRAFPKEAAWKKHRYDIAAMEVLWREKQAADEEEHPTRRPVRRASLKEMDKVREVNEELTKSLEESRDARSSTISENDQLRAEAKELREENLRLMGRIEELERLVDKQFSV